VRWHADLQEYDFDSLYISGKTNVIPDTLSCPPGADHRETDNTDVVMLPQDKFHITTAKLGEKTYVPSLNKVKQAIMRLMYDNLTTGHLG
jgi:hypothetical protein